MTEIAAELHEFACRSIEECGGLIDWPAAEAVGEVVLPSTVSSRLRFPTDVVPISAAPTPGGMHASLGGEFLDMFARLLDDCVPRVGTFTLPDRYLKKGDLHAAIDQRFVWQNARARLGEPVAEHVPYHVWRFQASLRSEDSWDGQIQVAVNAQSGCVVPLPDLLDDGVAELHPGDGPVLQAEDTYAIACARAERQLFVDAAAFINRLDDRFARDRKRLRDYYRALLKPASPRRKAVGESSPEDRQAKEEVVEMELKRKLLELEERYELHARLTPVVLMAATVNALVMPLHVQRKRAERDFHLYWNPLLRDFEPMGCSRCRIGTYSVTFADETVGPLCTPCSMSKGH